MRNFTEDQLKYYIKLLASQLEGKKIALPDKRLHEITLSDLFDFINAPETNHEQKAI